MSKQSLLHLRLLGKSNSDIVDYAEFTIKSVSYLDYRTVEEEALRLHTISHINQYWVLNKAERIGVVKISLFNFFDLGLKENLDKELITEILILIESNMRKSFTGKVHGNIDEKYFNCAINLDWIEEYSRYRMELKFKEVKGLVSYENLKYKNFNPEYITKLSNLFVDAYEGTKDENIGYIRKNTVSASMDDIIYGRYGELQPELSIIVFNKWGKKIIGASLITISEGCAFLVIIGVRKKDQEKGLGKAMLSYNIKRSIDAGYSCMKLWATVGIPAIELYKSIGFKIISKISSVEKKRISTF